ncbi:ABC transporter substrate-binding protein [Salinicoccus sp. ID82-1]|uniref:ABC transporter substrate-binding protein n=1 Tax=Salinicoccus sp. ID82-1 TaxID=2820269 RepID=UPI001F22DAEF|nr:ABC transporter substrate-binding protein [Salinicoccus sp. ID82-1]MCG1008470.1 ABC transporter substrate-binding protein [Salinicoccus sp. ID82-1]
MKKLYLLFTLVLALVLSACGNSGTPEEGADGSEGSASTGGDASTIKLYAPFSGPDGENMKQIVEDYNGSQEETQVDLQIVPQTDYYTTLDLTLSGGGEGDQPDLMVMHGDQIQTYVENGSLQEVAPLLDGDLNEDDYHEKALTGAEHEGTLYGIPFDIHPLMYFWNKDLVEQAGYEPDFVPADRDEFIEMTTAVSALGDDKHGFVVPTLWPQQFIFPTIVYQNGGQLIADGEVMYTSPEVTEAAQFLHDLIYEHQVSPTNVQQDGELTLFLQGNNAVMLNGPWMMNQLEESGLNYGVAPVPMLGTEQEAVFANSHNFVLPATVEDEAKMTAIKDFLGYVAENSMEWAESGQAPAAKAVYESEEFQSMEFQSNVAEQFDYVQFAPEVADWGPVSDPLFQNLNEILLDEQEVEPAMEEAQEASQSSLE